MRTEILKNITTKIGSGATPTGGQNAYHSEGISLIRSQNVLDFSFSKNGLAFIDDTQAKELNNVTVEENDILLNITGDSIARVCIVPKDILPARVNQHVSIIRPDDSVNSQYLFYYLQYLKPYLLKICGVGGTRNALTKEVIGELEISISENQNEITEILSVLDEKISLNNRINTELETMAKTIYNYWFVQFDFPNEVGKPYKTSGGEMVWNEELKRDIPKDWKCVELSKIAARIATGLNPRDNFVLGKGSNFYVTIKNIDYGKILLDERCDRVDDEILRIINRRSDLKVGDILFTSIQPVGRTYLIQDSPTNWNINESVFTIRPNYDLVTAEYMYMLLSSDIIKSFTKNSSTGSIHKGVRIEMLNSYQSPYCNPNLVSLFTELVNPMLNKINVLQKETQELITLRDFLLPLLMNGQVKVK